VQSILAQSFTDFELVISDNASTDSTGDICAELMRSDARIRYFRNPHNVGAGPNFNRAFELTSGPYFKWMAHDDALEPEWLKLCVEVLDNDPTVVLAYTKAVRMDASGAKGRPYGSGHSASSHSAPERFGNVMRRANWGLPVFGLVRRDVLLKTRGFVGSPGADHMLLSELALHGRFYEVPEYLMLHGIHSERYARSHHTRREKAGWYDPSRSGRLFFPAWRKLRVHLSSVHRSDLSVWERWRCYMHVGRWAAKNTRRLVSDVTLNIPTLPRALRRMMRGHLLAS
jgi:glycosyltransferase involved in cell wall biosynthesis